MIVTRLRNRPFSECSWSLISNLRIMFVPGCFNVSFFYSNVGLLNNITCSIFVFSHGVLRTLNSVVTKFSGCFAASSNDSNLGKLVKCTWSLHWHFLLHTRNTFTVEIAQKPSLVCAPNLQLDPSRMGFSSWNQVQYSGIRFPTWLHANFQVASRPGRNL